MLFVHLVYVFIYLVTSQFTEFLPNEKLLLIRITVCFICMNLVCPISVFGLDWDFRSDLHHFLIVVSV